MTADIAPYITAIVTGLIIPTLWVLARWLTNVIKSQFTALENKLDILTKRQSVDHDRILYLMGKAGAPLPSDLEEPRT